MNQSQSGLSKFLRLPQVGALNVRASRRAEWIWVAGRFVLSALAIAALPFVIDDHGALVYLISIATFAFVANAGLAIMLLAGHLKSAFAVGLALDTALVLAIWGGSATLLGGSPRLNDVHLATLPILAATVVRLGWPLGVAQGLMFTAWLVGANVILLDPGSFVADQTPLRAVLLVATALLTLWLVARIRIERDRSESLWHESEVLASLGRVVASTSDIDAMYGRFAGGIRALLPFDRLSLLVTEEDKGAMSLRYVDARDDTTSTGDRVYELSLAGLATEAKRPVRIASETALGAAIGTRGTIAARFKSSISAPIQHEGRIIGVITLHHDRSDAYSQGDERVIQRIADQIAGIFVRDLGHARELGLIERQAALESENEELERLSDERMEFASAVAHEFKTPLASMLAFTDILDSQRDGALNEVQKERLGVIKRNGKGLLRMLDDLLEISRFSAGALAVETTEFDLSELCEEIAADCRKTLDQRAQRLKLDLPGEPLNVNADRLRMAQVLNNLLSNASKYSPDSTTIALRLTSEADRVGISVSDNGIGIPFDDQRDLFEPFNRVDNEITRSVKGSGLGLAVARAIVQQHNGEITVDSKPGDGSTFWISMPVKVNGQSGLTEGRAA